MLAHSPVPHQRRKLLKPGICARLKEQKRFGSFFKKERLSRFARGAPITAAG